VLHESQDLTNVTTYSYTIQGNGRTLLDTETPGIISNGVWTTVAHVIAAIAVPDQPILITGSGSVTSSGSAGPDTMDFQIVATISALSWRPIP
jgi:hypothetical protein